ncbi:hypothetical protein JY651_18750 [Pyxidicoccus parkwayensis]|uniref:Kazal-like domain-containing protein n=1 Tax=Pyxidicoccus parkwayensis TaxID=2813578 RepID=A0ABX7PDQ9_9BACT|nr:hypothetical protein [Pyxidicoccus parkwaysis]QSQ28639.1 hypothetical protein JY651_18750 [Pyxidicoccus parkwaysis]
MFLAAKKLAILAVVWLAVPPGLAFAQEPEPASPAGFASTLETAPSAPSGPVSARGLEPTVLAGLAIAQALKSAAPQATAAAQEPKASKPSGPACGGIAGFACPEGYSCVDDPSDDCDPNNGGADCGGICTAAPEQSAQAGDGGTGDTKACDSSDPNVSYVSKDPERCSAIRFACEAGKEPFFNDCGCGCQPVAQ